MWTRKELKSKAKEALKRNYWKTVLVALLAIAISGGGAAGAAGRSSSQTTTDYTLDPETLVIEEGTLPDGIDETSLTPDELVSMVQDAAEEEGMTQDDFGALAAIAIGAFGLIVIVVMAIALLISAFLLNPLKVGTTRFFLSNLNRPAAVREVTYGFDHNYRQVVKTMFWRDIYTILWCMLLVVPGIIKSYQYRMIPYLLADDPTMTKDQAFAESKRMMNGQKWNAFVLDLSFLGWSLLTALTLGAAGVFFVFPYKNMTDAALFEALRYGQGTPAGYGYQLDAAGNSSQVPVPPFAADDATYSSWGDEA